MPQTSAVFSSILGPGFSGQVPPGMGERGGGAGGSGDLIFQDGHLISGSLEALMEHLVPTVDYYPDVSVCSLERAVPGVGSLVPEAASGVGERPRKSWMEQWGDAG